MDETGIVMATTREIRERISSVDDTLKITNAMYLISSTKLRKARKALADTEPYFDMLQLQMERIMRHLPEDFTHPYLDSRAHVPDENLRRAVIVVTADKGLAGAYNHNVLKMAEKDIRPDADDMLFVIGETGRVYFQSKGIHIDEQFHYTAQNPTIHRARSIAFRMLDLYGQKKIDEVFILYTRMINSIEAEPRIMQLLPLSKLGVNRPEAAGVADVYQEAFELFPSPREIIENLVPNYLTGYIFGALVESYCCEHNARMMAMDAAGKNGREMKQKLSIEYNRLRQAKITQEITEVCAGARAQQRQAGPGRAGIR